MDTDTDKTFDNAVTFDLLPSNFELDEEILEGENILDIGNYIEKLISGEQLS